MRPLPQRSRCVRTRKFGPNTLHSSIFTRITYFALLFALFILEALEKTYAQSTQWLWNFAHEGEILRTTTDQFDQPISNTVHPGPRNFHSIVVATGSADSSPTRYSGTLYLGFGSRYETAVDRLNDLWRFSYPTQTWTKLRGGNSNVNQPGVMPTKGTSDPTYNPGSRSSPSLAIDNAKALIYMFGGFGKDGSGGEGYLNDLWCYNITLNEWTWLSGSSIAAQWGNYTPAGTFSAAVVPSSRFQHSLLIDGTGRYLYLFGGYGLDSTGVEGVMNDLWAYDTSLNLWSWISGNSTRASLGVMTPGTRRQVSTVNVIGARMSHVAVYDTVADLIYIHGGQRFDVSSGNLQAARLWDLWSYNVSTGNWMWLSGSASSNVAAVYGTKGVAASTITPGGRINHVAAIAPDGKSFFVFGGTGADAIGGVGFINDLFVYDVTSGWWTWVSGSNRIFEYPTTTLYGKPDPSNVIGARTAAAGAADDFGSLWVSGGQGYPNITDGTIPAGKGAFLSDIWIWQKACPPGYWGLTGAEATCQPCPVGSYKVDWGNGAAADVCNACPAHTTTTGTAKTLASDCECDIGFGSATAVNPVCVACAVDNYKDWIGNAVCLACNSASTTNGVTGATASTQCLCKTGKYGTTGHSSCTNCPSDTYKETVGNGAVGICTACSASSSTNGATGATQSSNCLCRPGYYGVTGDASCFICPIGSFKPTFGNGDASVCTACPANSVTNTGVPPTSNSACLCAPGYSGLYGATSPASTTCSPCAVGTYKTTAGNGAPGTVCTACPAGTTTTASASDAASNCSVCAAGWEGDATTNSCTRCAANFFKTSSGNTACTACNAASTTNGQIGRTSASQCLCKAGFFGSSGHNSCTLCPVNTYKTSIGNAGSCQACPSTSTTQGTTGATASSQCICNAGYYGDGSSCTACPANTYKTAAGNGVVGTVCTACPANAVTLGATAVTALSTCTCPAGFGGLFGAYTSCFPCPVDTFKSTTTKVDCTPCGSDSTTNGTSQATASTQCQCKAGFFGSTGHTSCTMCPADTFKSSIGNTAACTSCPPEATTQGSTSSTATSQCICNAGYYGDGSTCAACPSDTYKTTAGNGAAASVCTACPTNSTTLGATAVTAANNCTCPAGFGGLFGGYTSCYPCPVDTFKSTAGTVDCTACSINSTTNGAVQATLYSQCECKPGFYGSTGHTSCTECAADLYKDTIGNTNTCTACALRGSTVAITGATNSTLCLCSPGTYGVGSVNCTDCPVDTYKSSYGDGTAATCLACPANATTNGLTGRSSMTTHCACPPGYWGMTASNTACSPCPVGTYKPAWGVGDEATVCLPCPLAHQTTSDPGKTAVTDCMCAPGYGYSAPTNMTSASCNACEVDTYKTTASNASCDICAIGSTTNGTSGSTDAAACVCAPGFYGSGDASCAACPVDTFKMSPGNGVLSSVCTLCATGSTTGGSSGRSAADQCMCAAGYSGFGHTTCVPCGTALAEPSYKDVVGNNYYTNVTTSLVNVTLSNGTVLGPYVAGDLNLGALALQLLDETGNAVSITSTTPYTTTSPELVERCMPCIQGAVLVGGSWSNQSQSTATSITYCRCPLGTYGAATAGTGVCTTCPEGTYVDSNAVGDVLSCTNCPTGFSTSQNGSTSIDECNVCAAGYEPTTAPEDCTPCMSGFVKTSAGNTSCVPAPSNTSSTITSATATPTEAGGSGGSESTLSTTLAAGAGGGGLFIIVVSSLLIFLYRRKIEQGAKISPEGLAAEAGAGEANFDVTFQRKAMPVGNASFSGDDAIPEILTENGNAGSLVPGQLGSLRGGPSQLNALPEIGSSNAGIKTGTRLGAKPALPSLIGARVAATAISGISVLGSTKAKREKEGKRRFFGRLFGKKNPGAVSPGGEPEAKELPSVSSEKAEGLGGDSTNSGASFSRRGTMTLPNDGLATVGSIRGGRPSIDGIPLAGGFSRGAAPLESLSETGELASLGSSTMRGPGRLAPLSLAGGGFTATGAAMTAGADLLTPLGSRPHRATLTAGVGAAVLAPLGPKRSISAGSGVPPLPLQLAVKPGVDFKLTKKLAGTMSEGEVLSQDVAGCPPGSKVLVKSMEGIATLAAVKAAMAYACAARHPNIVKILGFSEEPPTLLVQQYTATFADVVFSRQPLPMGKHEMIRDVVSAVQKIHMLGIAHGNLKATNLFFEPVNRGTSGAGSGSSGGVRVVVADIGMDFTTKSSGIKAGNVPYSSPEMLREFGVAGTVSATGAMEANPIMLRDMRCKNDVFAVGVLIYEVIERRKVWSAPPPSLATPSPNEIAAKVLRGERPMFLKQNESDKLVEVAQLCWAHEAEKRINVHDLEEAIVS